MYTSKPFTMVFVEYYDNHAGVSAEWYDGSKNTVMEICEEVGKTVGESGYEYAYVTYEDGDEYDVLFIVGDGEVVLFDEED